MLLLDVDTPLNKVKKITHSIACLVQNCNTPFGLYIPVYNFFRA